MIEIILVIILFVFVITNSLEIDKIKKEIKILKEQKDNKKNNNQKPLNGGFY